MRRWLRTGATLLFGVGIGASVSRLPSVTGWAEEEERPGTLPGLLSRVPVVPVPRVQASELTVSPGGSGTVMKYGFPSLANIKTRESYVTSYDPRTRTASWVIERLNPASLNGPSDRKYCNFKEDDSVHVFHRSTNADFRGSGFDRGHLAAAANHKWSQKAMEDTFYLSNVAPQNPHLNQNTWNNLEQLCRSLTKHYLNVYVCTGPLYLPRQEADGKLYVRYQVLGRNHVAVPTHFFKVLILEQVDGRGVELRSYVLPNEPIDEKVPLDRFLVPIETIERASGLHFVPNIMKRTSSLQAITAR
ncbi:endonuclease G, mitochondrial [Cyclopterus lumpus]|uniref:Endonuclease n=1 Tax=Cyclopterus lumpus TaxID=8103 RepID=A0A8C2WNH0_CYCLU|nr:endonuclease G, mitochondrial [Cyclopterus lumpus]XP_034398322.1 endonuclease G, mitochondrial [Cyclopterus lumpus]XP_034398323.1 endonuclease G, mitochondrial [Cyclopterus lumpus]